MESKRKACFICGTPFHVFTSIILKYQLDIESDIIIYDAFPNTKELQNNLEKEKIFGSVKVLDKDKEYGLPKPLSLRYIYSLFGYFRIKKIVSKVLPELKDYSDVFFANAQVVDVIDRFNYCFLKKYYPNINLYIIDEGWQCYDEKFYQLTRLDYIFRKFVVRANTHVLDMGVYIYNPDLYNMVNRDKKLNILPIIKPKHQVLEKLKSVFSYVVLDDLSQFDMIIFDTVREEEFTKVGSGKFDQIIKNLVGDKKVIVKPHPRDKTRYFNYDYFKTDGFPFEILCLFNNFDDYVFLNNNSSAVFSPKIVFDQEPKIIFAYKAVEKYMQDVNGIDRDYFVSCIRKLYRDPSKVIILDE